MSKAKKTSVLKKTVTAYEKYTDYIKNAGGSPLLKWFDDDWDPIGPTIRKEMETLGLVRVIEGRIYLT